MDAILATPALPQLSPEQLQKLQQQQAAQMAAQRPQFPPCAKCGSSEGVTQLRKVLVTVGWRMTQINAVAPARMCLKCGHTVCHIETQVGELAGLVPEPQATVAPQTQQAPQSQAVVPEPAPRPLRKKVAKKATKKK